MLQRIQTVFLLGALLVVSALFWFPSLTCAESLQATMLLQGMVVGTGLVTLFLYKRRKAQMRLCLLLCLLLAVLQAAFVYFAVQEEACRWQWSVVFPAIAIILTLLARRRIAKDEALVRSLDRLR